MDLVSAIFLICFLVGLGFAIISAFLSGVMGHLHIGGADHDVDIGGHDVDVGGHDIDIGAHDVDIGGHDIDVGGHDIDIGTHDVDVGGHDANVGEHSVDTSSPHLSPVSPIMIATFITSFGGVGFIFNENLRIPLPITLPVASFSGVAIAGALFFIFYKIFKVTQASSEPTRQSVMFSEAKVITPIPADGVGEIAYIAKGSRFTAAARAEERVAIPKHSMVRITKIVGNAFYVNEIPDEKLRRLADEI
ncbi:MAG: hypothetical protein H8D67_15880 [Deltaproteobacteria bacterium]|nr:hypothetical protein [Deltaproteobacteria bacterium]